MPPSPQFDNPPPGTLGADGRGFVPPTISRLKEWVRIAQPNARMTYAVGATLDQACRGELRDKVYDLTEKGWLTPHFVRGRDGGPSFHIVQRTRRPYYKGNEL